MRFFGRDFKSRACRMRSSGRPIARATVCPDGRPSAFPRRRSRSASAWIPLATASGRMLSPNASFVSILRLGWTSSRLPENSKNRAHWITCPAGSARKPRRSSAGGFAKIGISCTSAFSSYSPRTMLCPNRYAATENSTGMNGRALQSREEVVDDGPLVMPADDPACLVEPPFRGQLGDGRRLDDLVVILEEAEGELGDDQVLVVPGVPEERAALRVPREVVLARLILPDEHSDAVVLVQERLVVRAPPVQGVEVEAGRAEVDERIGIVVPLQLRRRIEGQVVVDELPEVREARGDVRVVARADVLPFLRLRLDHGPGERVERVVRREEGGQVREHPPESALERGGAQDRADAPDPP